MVIGTSGCRMKSSVAAMLVPLLLFWVQVSAQGDDCYEESAISRMDDGVVTACVNGYSTSVCYPNDYYVESSLAEAACSSQGLELDYSNYSSAYSSGLVLYACPSYAQSIHDCNFTYTNSCQLLIAHCREPVECYGDSRLANVSYYYDANGTQYIIGTLETCVNGKYYPSCLDSLPEDICSSSFYYDNSVTLPYPYPLGDSNCYNITSSDQLYVANPGCYDNNCTLVPTCTTPLNEITCVSPPYIYTCYDGDMRLSNGSSLYYPSGYRAYSGRVEVCVNGEFVYVCSGSVDVQAVCNYIGYSVGQELPYESQYVSSGTGLFANFSCSSNYSSLGLCSTTTSCSSNPLVVNCIQECWDGQSRLVNSSTATTYNDNGMMVNSISGLIEVCINSSWLTVCYDSSDQFTEGNKRAVNLTCQDMGYDGGKVVTGMPSSSSSPVLYNISCPEYAYGFYSCSYSDMPPQACLNHQLDAVVMCYDVPNDYYHSYSPSGHIYYYSNGTHVDATIQYAQVYINNTYITVCASGLEEADVQLLCRDTGADYGYLVQSKEVQGNFYPPITQAGVTNINCSDYNYYFDPYSCSYQVSYDHCNASGGPALLTCVFNDIYTCSEGEITLVDHAYGYDCNGTEVAINSIHACVNSRFVPVCNSGLNPEDAQTICQSYLGYSAIAVSGPIEGFPYTPVTSGETDSVITNLTCPYDYYNCLVDVANESSCTNFGGNAVVACIRYSEPSTPDCYDGEVRQANSYDYTEMYSSDPYTPITVGFLEVCYQGIWISVCLNKTNNTDTSQLAELACRSINGFGGYSNVIAQTNYDYTNYDYSAVDFVCSSSSYYLSDCSFTLTDDPVCQTHQYDAYLTCAIETPTSPTSAPTSGSTDTPTAPEITTPPVEQNVPYKGQANFTCLASGTPNPVHSWLKNGERIPGENLPTLYFPIVQVSDRGLYSCAVANSVGSDASEQVYLRITDVIQYSSRIQENANFQKRETLPALLEMVINELTGQVIIGPNGNEAVIVEVDLYIADPNLVITIQDVTGFVCAEDVDNLLANFSTANITFLPAQRYDGCLADTIDVSGGTIAWVESSIGDVVTVTCSCGNVNPDTIASKASQTCAGDFTAAGMWEMADVADCIFSNTTISLCMLSNNTNPAQVADTLAELTGEPDNLDANDVGIIAGFVEEIAIEAAQDEETRDDYLDTLNNLLNLNQSIVAESEEETGAADLVLDSIQSFGANVMTMNVSAFIRPNFAIEVAEFSDNFVGVTFVVALDDNGKLGEDSLDSGGNRPTSSIDLPPTLLAGRDTSNNTRVVFGTYVDDTFFIQREGDKVVVTSIIISADVYDELGSVAVQNLSAPVQLSFVSSGGSARPPLCVFYNEEQSSWDSTGCDTVRGNRDTVECECYHLSSFTIVEDTGVTPATTIPSQSPVATVATPEPESVYEVEIILFVGPILAVFVILLTLVLYAISDVLRRNVLGKVIITAYIVLVVLYIVIVIAAGASLTDSDAFCVTMAAFVQYLMTAYLFWMFAEALFYILRLRSDLGENMYTRQYYLITAIVCFAVPLLVVCITVASTVSRSTDDYIAINAFCRPQNITFCGALLAPVILVYVLTLALNAVAFVYSTVASFHTAETPPRKAFVMPNLFTSIILNLVFGVVLSFLISATEVNVVGSTSTILQYLFAVAAIIHAILTFVFIFVRAKETRSLCNNLFNCINGPTSKKTKLTGEIAYVENEYSFEADKKVRPQDNPKSASEPAKVNLMEEEKEEEEDEQETVMIIDKPKTDM